MNDLELRQIVRNFKIEGEVQSIDPFGGGHINDTFLVQTSGEQRSKYVLQKINTYVFKDADGLMNNIATVTEHIRKKLRSNGKENLDKCSLRLIRTKSDDTYIITEENQYWRIFNFIDDHVVFDGATNHDIAFEGARMFGEFIHQLSDLNPENIVETIPNFHNIRFRLSNLEQAIKEDPEKRVCCLEKEIDYVRSRYEVMSVIQNLGEKGLITPRIVHNDTKINNVLFDQNNKGLCVVDLDTIMPGYVHYDFGDGIRTCANTGEEDDEDLNNIEYDLEIFTAFTSGFIQSVHSILNEQERKSLAHAALLFPFIMGVRFLTDYIAGDVYYKVKHSYHNYFRARAQFKLAQDGESKLEEMQRIIDGVYKS